MDRREVLQRVSILLGGTILGANAFLAGCRSGDSSTTGEGVNFTESDIAYLDEVAETILPTTSSPGAKAAKVGAFMTVMVKDCYEEGDQKIFREGMKKLDDASKKKFDKSFMAATPAQRTELLIAIDKEVKDEIAKHRQDQDAEKKANEQKAVEEKEKQSQNSTTESEKTSLEKQQEKPKANPPRHYFRMMKELTLLGYFTSEIGQTQALRYNREPGKYEGCVPYTKGEKAWA